MKKVEDAYEKIVYLRNSYLLPTVNLVIPSVF